MKHIKVKNEDGTKKTGEDMKNEVAEKVFEIFGLENFKKVFTDDVTDSASIAFVYHQTNGVNPCIERKKLEKERKKLKKNKINK